MRVNHADLFTAIPGEHDLAWERRLAPTFKLCEGHVAATRRSHNTYYREICFFQLLEKP
jgi:hypothetical protein